MVVNMREFSPIERQYPPSYAQLDIYRTVWGMNFNGETLRNLMIVAGAGSGKSTTLTQTLQFFKPNKAIGYLTFMTAAKRDLTEKVGAEKKLIKNIFGYEPRAEVRTIHSLGYGCLARKLRWKQGVLEPTFDDAKYNKLIRTYIQEHTSAYDRDYASSVIQFADKVMSRLLDLNDDEALKDLVLEYLDQMESLPLAGEQWELAKAAVQYAFDQGLEMAVKDNIICNMDLVRLPRVLGLTPWQFDVVIIDECQDMSDVEKEFAFSACRRGGQIIVIGDPDQAIYHFKGAREDGMERMRKELDPIILNLNTCYRCGKDIVSVANNFKPELEAFEDNRPGTVEYLSTGDVEQKIRPGDFVLGRRRAPLVDLCWRLIRNGVSATVRGKNIGSEVNGHLEKIVKFYPDKFNFAKFIDFVYDYQGKQLTILNQNEEENEKRIDQLKDRTDTLLALYDFYLDKLARTGKQPDLANFIAEIEDFFKEDNNAQVVMSTIHSAKGLEFDRVFFLEFDDQEKRAQGSDEERFIAYVGVTRAKSYLGLVERKARAYNPQPIEEEKELQEEVPTSEPVWDEPAKEETPTCEEAPIQEEPAQEEEQTKKRAGRPKGAKNAKGTRNLKDTTLAFDAEFAEAILKAYGVRGRSGSIQDLILTFDPNVAKIYNELKNKNE